MRPVEPTDATVAPRSILRTARASVLFALTVFAATVVQVLATPVSALVEGDGEWPFDLSEPLVFSVLVLGCGVQAVALAVSDRLPRTAVAVITLVYLGLAIGLEVPSWLTGMYLVIALSLFLLATRRSAAVALVWLAITVAAVVGSLLWWMMLVLGASINVAAWWISAEAARFVAPAAAGATLGIWWTANVRRMRAAREEAEQARREHAARVAEAQSRERARIAQELHDVAGQHLAGLITLADAAMKIAPAQPEHALGLLEEVRDEGRFAAASLAGALSDLRATSPESVAAVRDLRHSQQLVDYWRGRSMHIDYSTSGDIANLPAVVSTSSYRCLQEALTNAAKHAAGAEVNAIITASETSLELVVRNAPPVHEARLPGLSLGWGLQGMTERVELLQGKLTAQPLTDGGWELRIYIPTVATS